MHSLLDADADDVVLVVCQPDRPKGRGKRPAPPPVKLLALERGIEIVQPAKMKDGTLTARLNEATLDLAVVAAFGRIITQETLDAPTHGFWNVHTSVLPRHRGASPIQHAILCGDAESGVTLMQMTAGLDEGPALHTARLALDPRETAAGLHDKLAAIGGSALVQAIATAKSGGLPIAPQDHSAATYAPLLKKADGALDFARTAIELDRQIRGLNPWPGTFVPLADGQPLRITAAQPVAGTSDLLPGVVAEAAVRLVLQTGDGLLELLALQPPGKRAVAAADYLRGSGRHTEVGQPLAGS